MPKESHLFEYEPVVNPRRTRAEETAAPEEWPARAMTERTEEGAARSGKEESDAPPPERLLRSENWSLKRGHSLSFAGLLAFTAILYFRPQDYFPALAAASIALIAALIALAAYIPAQLTTEGNLTARPREVNLLLLLCVAAALSVPLAISPGAALGYFWDPVLKNAVVFILIINIVRTEARLKILLYLALAITIVLCLHALNDYRLGNLTVEGYRIEGRSGGGMFQNTNDLGVHLVTILPIALALGLSARNIVGKLLCYLCSLAILGTIVVTFSRGAFLALVAVTIFMAWKLGQRNRPVVFATFFLCTVLFLLAVPGEFWTRIASIFDSSLDRFGSSTARSELLKRSLVVTIANPLLGVGIGNFTQLSARAQVTHNAYTQVSAEMGLAAAVIYTMFIVAPLKRLRLIERATFTTRRASKFYYLAVGLQASLVGYMVSSFFASVAFYLYIYFLVGYAVCLRRLYLAAAAEQPESARGARARLARSS